MTVSSLNSQDGGFFFIGKPKVFDQNLTIQHWQLRDLLTCPEKENEVYLINHYSVNCFNTDTGESNSVLKYLTYAPTSMAINHGYLAVGGHRADLTVRHLNTSWLVRTTVGGSINNSLTIFSHNGEKRLLVSNNDQTIKVYSLPDFRKLDTIEFPTAVNHAAVSPDGTKLVAVGDSPQIFLYNIRGNDFEPMGILSGTGDSGFSCSWNQSSDKFATASQDGYVLAWDIRKSQSIARFTTHQSSTKGAARCVKFSQSGSIDLLVYSEHVSYFNMVDARTFNSRQVIRAAPPHQDQNISGICFTPSCKSLYVGLESSIQKYSIDTVSRRCFQEGSIN